MITGLRNRSGFLKNTFKLVAGTAVSQAITLLLAPVIARLYTPAEMGLFTFFMSLAGGFALIATLRYEMAIILPQNDRESVDLTWISTAIAFALMLCLLAAALIFQLTGTTLFAGFPHATLLTYLLPVMVFFTATGNIFQHWYNRKQHYRSLAVSKIINSAGNNVMTLLLGLAGLGAWGLITGNLTGLLLFNLFFLVGLTLRYRDHFRFSTFRFNSGLARRYKEFPLSNTPQMLVELIQLYGIIYLLKIFYVPEIIGLYALAQRVLQAPMWLIGTSLGQVFYKEASTHAKDSGFLFTTVRKTIRIALMIAAPVVLILLISGPWLIGFIFGKAWTEAGQIARILAPMMFFDFIRATIAQTPLITGKTRNMLYISMIGAFLTVVSIIAGGIFFHNVLAAFMVYSALMSLYSAGVIWWILNMVRNR
ncbi:MAG: hypothetical protein EOM90_07345 [Alphaproteobacteria bacterium]|nr:hypothetical protein [Alphaproteobacteria bacterium]